jgi:hypothetical protein
MEVNAIQAVRGAIVEFPPPLTFVAARLAAQHEAAWKRAVSGALEEVAPPTVPRLGTTVDVLEYMLSIYALPTHGRDHVANVLDDTCLFAFGAQGGAERVGQDVGSEALSSRFSGAEIASRLDFASIV